MAEHKRKTTKEFLRLKSKLRRLSKGELSSSTPMPKAYPKQKFAFLKMDEYNHAYNQMKGSQGSATKSKQNNEMGKENTDIEVPITLLAAEFSGNTANPDQLKHRIFSQELASSGKRTFISSSINTFFDAYLSIPPRKRHYYEIIREHSPCRLYFDCEFYKEFNPTVNGDSMVGLFTRYVATALQSHFGIMVSLENFLDLDSSTDSKCSHHIIVHLPDNQLFVNNLHVGNFVTKIANDCKPSMSAPGTSQRYASELWIRGKKNDMCFFADLAVYTKNRAFRLLYSSKFQRDTILLPSKQNQFPIDMMSKNGEKQLFLDSLISFTASERPSSLTHLEFQWKNNMRSNIAKETNEKYVKKITTNVDTIPSEILKVVDFLTHAENISIAVDSIRVSMDQSSDQHILDLGTLDNNRSEQQENKNCTYILGTRTRKCRIAKRTHKSNHIWLKINVSSKTVFQHCHDEDCRHGFFKLNVPETLFGNGKMGSVTNQCSESSQGFK